MAPDFLSTCIEERNRFEEDVTGKVEPPLPRGLVIDGPALLEAMRTPDSQGALLRAAQVRKHRLEQEKFPCELAGWTLDRTQRCFFSFRFFSVVNKQGCRSWPSRRVPGPHALKFRLVAYSCDSVWGQSSAPPRGDSGGTPSAVPAMEGRFGDKSPTKGDVQVRWNRVRSGQATIT